MSAEILKATWLLKSFWILLCLIGWKAQAQLMKLGNRNCKLDLFSIYIFSLFCSFHLTLCCFMFSRGTTYCIWWWSSFPPLFWFYVIFPWCFAHISDLQRKAWLFIWWVMLGIPNTMPFWVTEVPAANIDFW